MGVDLKTISRAIDYLVMMCHWKSVENGWYADAGKGDCVPTKISLIHSEVSEALEGHRKGLKDDHLPHRAAIEVELADAVIRIADLAGYLQLDLGGAIMEKVAYNDKRADHKLENRAKEGGKKF